MVAGIGQINYHEYRHVGDGIYENYLVTIRQEPDGSLVVLDRSSWDTCWYPVEEFERSGILKMLKKEK